MTAVDHEYESEKAEYRRDTTEPKPSLFEALAKAARGMKLEPSETATRADIAYLDGHNAALAEFEAEIAKHFAALSVDDVARAIAGYEPLLWKHMGEVSKREHVEKAQAVMQLLRGVDV